MTLSEKDHYEDIGFLPPLGLAYLAGAVSREGHCVEIIDCPGICPMHAEVEDGWVRCGMPAGEILSRIKKFRPVVVGITCPYTANASDALEIAGQIKEDYSRHVPVIMGGTHVSIDPKSVLSNDNVDFVAVGEGA